MGERSCALGAQAGAAAHGSDSAPGRVVLFWTSSDSWRSIHRPAHRKRSVGARPMGGRFEEHYARVGWFVATQCLGEVGQNCEIAHLVTE